MNNAVDAQDIAFHVPLILRGLCYLSAMSLFASTFFWLARASGGYGNDYTLPQISLVWVLRVLAACAAGSLITMIFFRQIDGSPWLGLPEASLLLLLMALYSLRQRHQGHATSWIFGLGLAQEILKTAGIILMSCAGMGLLVGGWWLAYHVNAALQGPEWVSGFVAGILLNAPLLFLFMRVRDSENISFPRLLWPLALAYLLIILPDLLEHLGNAPKIQEFMEGRPRLQRA